MSSSGWRTNTTASSPKDGGPIASSIKHRPFLTMTCRSWSMASRGTCRVTWPRQLLASLVWVRLYPKRSIPAVITGLFLNFFPCNHIINKIIIIFFFREVKNKRQKLRCLLLRRKKKIIIFLFMMWLHGKIFKNSPVITTLTCVFICTDLCMCAYIHSWVSQWCSRRTRMHAHVSARKHTRSHTHTHTHAEESNAAREVACCC